MKATQLLFPPRCALCHELIPEETEDGLCADCRSMIQQERERWLHRSLLYAEVICAAEYRGSLRRALLRVKTSGVRAPIAAMKRIAYQAYQHQCGDFCPDVVTFVPSSALRVHTRGFTLPQEIADYAAQQLGVPCRPLIQHTWLSPRQAGMQREQRREHARRSLSISPTAELEGQRILLVDDIITSGETMGSAARLLWEARASEVVGLALAKSAKK